MDLQQWVRYTFCEQYSERTLVLTMDGYQVLHGQAQCTMPLIIDGDMQALTVGTAIHQE